MKDGKIKVNRDTTRIQVNDKRDFIEIDFNNQSFVENIIKIYDYSKNNRPKFDDSSKSSIEKISILFKYNNEILNLIDKTFGENSVIKIFGIKHPTEDLVLDFIIQLKPYIEKAIEEKKKKVEMQQKEYQKRASSRESVR